MYKIKFFKQKKNNSTLPSALDYNYNEENVSVHKKRVSLNSHQVSQLCAI